MIDFQTCGFEELTDHFNNEITTYEGENPKRAVNQLIGFYLGVCAVRFPKQPKNALLIHGWQSCG